MRYVWLPALWVVLSGLALAAPQLDVTVATGLVSIQAREVPLNQLLITLGEKASFPVRGSLDEKTGQQLINFQLDAVPLPRLLEELKRVTPFNYLLTHTAGKRELWLLQAQKPITAAQPPTPPAANPNTQTPPPIIPPPRQ